MEKLLAKLNPQTVSVLLLVIGLALFAVPLWDGNRFTTEKLIELIAHALIVAAILSLTVDGYLKERIAADGLHALLHAALGVDQPPAVRSIIEKVGKMRYIRKDYCVTYVIKHESDAIIRLYVDSEFKVENLTKETIEFVHTAWVRSPDPGYESRIVAAEAEGTTDDYAKPFKKAGPPGDPLWNRLTLDQTEPNKPEPEPKSDLLWEKTVKIAAGKTAKFLTQVEQTLPSTYIDVFYFSDTTLGVKVKCVGGESMRTSVVFESSTDEDKSKPKRRSDGDEWSSPAIFLENSSFTFQWTPDRKTAGTSQPKARH